MAAASMKPIYKACVFMYVTGTSFKSWMKATGDARAQQRGIILRTRHQRVGCACSRNFKIPRQQEKMAGSPLLKVSVHGFQEHANNRRQPEHIPKKVCEGVQPVIRIAQAVSRYIHHLSAYITRLRPDDHHNCFFRMRMTSDDAAPV